MNSLFLTCLVLSVCVVITVAIKKFEYDVDCIEYMSEFQQDSDDCTVHNEKMNNENVDLFHYEFNSFSNRDGESYDFFNQWRDRNIYTPTFSSKDSVDHCSCKETFCQCSGRNLKHVPKDLLYSITRLDISINFISNLPNCSFCNYTHLTYLDLSTNNLTQLEVGSFSGLIHLAILNLKSNRLLYLKKTFPIGVFSDLKSLQCLKMNGNIHNNSRSIFEYPDKVLVDLIKLRTLYIDGLNSVRFGENFKNLSRLTTLVLGGYNEGNCDIISLSENSFKNLVQISSLDISFCRINGRKSSKDAFKPLVNLHRLDVSCNYQLSVQYLMEALSNVREYNITSLKMSHIESMFSSPIVINSVMIESLPTYLRYLEAQGNNFQSVDQGALQLLPPNLTYLEAGGNRFLYGEYFKELSSIKSLKILKLNGGLYIQEIPKKLKYGAQNRARDNDEETKSEPLILHLPPNLLCLSMRFSGLRYLLTELTFHENNSLESLILTNNDFPSVQGPIKGLPKLLKLYLSNSNVQNLDQRMFQHMVSLQELRLRTNKLKDFFRYFSGKPVFEHLKNLKIFDLSINSLTVIPDRVFLNLTNLEELDLSQNNIDQFNVTLENMFNLKRLNLSNTHLSSLQVVTRNNIDLLLQSNHSVRIDMSKTPIRCECNNIDFIKWMVNSKAFDSKFTGYMCQYEDTSTKIVSDSYEETLHSLAIKCADHSTIFLVVISATLCLISFVVFAVLYRFRWKLRYLYHAAYIMLKDKKKNQCEKDSFRYDVFISYASEDEEFILEKIVQELNQRELKSLVHGRDFAVGEFIASNIVTAVKESRKTLVVLTRHLLNSTWCNFEIQMANMESVYTGRPVLVFLIKESIPTTELTSDLLYHLKRNTYIEYPKGQVTRVFWDKLARDLHLS